MERDVIVEAIKKCEENFNAVKFIAEQEMAKRERAETIANVVVMSSIALIALSVIGGLLWW